jgi:hypothetical protein
MGFCEMVYHETRNFPEAEKEGLAKELRLGAMLLLRTITRESIKPQKEFLKSLDSTVEIQLDVLLLLKLAFRMGFIDQGVYQTMEEDLKGLEHIVNEMKGMHGIPISAESIYSHITAVKSKPEESKPKPEPVKPKIEEKSVPERQGPKPQPGHSSRRSRSPRPKPIVSSKPDIIKKEPEAQKVAVKKPEEPKPVEKKPEIHATVPKKVFPEEFSGTPLYDDDPPPMPSHSSSESNNDSEKNPRQSESASDKHPRKRKGRWTLKRSVGRKSSEE